MSFNLEHLELFKALAVAESFTQVANELNVPQPTISRKIKQLEQRFGLLLFERNTRKLTLTDAGQQLLPHVNRILADVSRAESSLDALKHKDGGTVTIEATPGIIAMLLREFVSGFNQSHPDIALKFNTLRMDQHYLPMQSDVRIHHHHPQQESLIYRRGSTYQPQLLVHPDFAARHPKITHPRDLANIPCIVLPNFDGSSDYVSYLEDDAVIQVRIRNQIQVDSYHLGLEACLQGVGALLCPTSILTEEQAKQVDVALPAHWFPRQGINIYHRQPEFLTQAAQTFIRALSTFYIPDKHIH